MKIQLAGEIFSFYPRHTQFCNQVLTNKFGGDSMKNKIAFMMLTLLGIPCLVTAAGYDLANPEYNMAVNELSQVPYNQSANIEQHGASNNAHIDQRGSKLLGVISQNGGNNSAQINQSGSYNLAYIDQAGSANDASITQGAYGNSAVIIQKGSGNRANITQYGTQKTAVVVQRQSQMAIRVIQR